MSASKDLICSRYTVDIEKSDTGLFYATSADLPGLLAVATREEDVDLEIRKAISALFQAQGIEMYPDDKE